MAELSKIKAEKARDEAEKEAGRREEDEQIRMENILSGEITIFVIFFHYLSSPATYGISYAHPILSGNPLLKEKYSDTGKTDMKIKKRWDDDVVFKNCSRAEPDAKETNFINDSLRNEFHKRFMDKYIK